MISFDPPGNQEPWHCLAQVEALHSKQDIAQLAVPVPNK